MLLHWFALAAVVVEHSNWSAEVGTGRSRHKMAVAPGSRCEGDCSYDFLSSYAPYGADGGALDGAWYAGGREKLSGEYWAFSGARSFCETELGLGDNSDSGAGNTPALSGFSPWRYPFHQSGERCSTTAILSSLRRLKSPSCCAS